MATLRENDNFIDIVKETLWERKDLDIRFRQTCMQVKLFKRDLSK